MEELIVQSDGCYVLCFKNYKKISVEEVESIFKQYGDVFSIRVSSESIPWVFIRYKVKEEAQNALDDLRGYDDFEIRIAKSNQKKKQDHDGDREKSDCFSEGSRENRSTKGSHNKNRGSERFVMDSDDNDRYPSGSPQKASLFTSKNQKTHDGKDSRGREDSGNSRRSFDHSPPRLVKKFPGNHSANGAVAKWKQLDDGPPKLVKGSEYYASATQINSTTKGFALKAAYEEVWANHPLRSKVQLKEVIMTNFDSVPSKKEIYDFCSPVKPLHVSLGMTKSESAFYRVLVATDGEVSHLCSLSSANGVYVTTLEVLLDEFFLEPSVG